MKYQKVLCTDLCKALALPSGSPDAAVITPTVGFFLLEADKNLVQKGLESPNPPPPKKSWLGLHSRADYDIITDYVCCTVFMAFV